VKVTEEMIKKDDELSFICEEALNYLNNGGDDINSYFSSLNLKKYKFSGCTCRLLVDSIGNNQIDNIYFVSKENIFYSIFFQYIDSIYSFTDIPTIDDEVINKSYVSWS